MTTHSRRLFTADSRFAVTPSATEGGMPTLTGYAIVWNALSNDRGGWQARIAPGTVSFATPTAALFHHDYRLPLGTTENQTLRLSTDDYGVKVEIDLPPTTGGKDTAILVARRDVRGMSFNMTTDPSGPIVVTDGKSVKTLDPFTIDEVTVTMVPAFDLSSIDIKTPAAAEFSTRREHQSRLDRLRFSRFQRPAALSARLAAK